MSLDVWLTTEDYEDKSKDVGRIFVRKDGRNVEISRQEWDALYPGREPLLVFEDYGSAFSANITHNLGPMASAANLYVALWRPEELGISKAEQLIEILQEGLDKLKADPDEFRKYNPSNGWGTYEGLVDFVGAYLNACREYPQATIGISR